MKKTNITKNITAVALALAVAAAMMPAAAVASSASAKTAYGSAAVKWTPKGKDLRARGVVTPVKNQNPWSTCWAFGTMAAAETSILSMEKTTYKKKKLDLSERHLIYFSDRMITGSTNKAQAGEGVTFEGNKKDPNLLFNTSAPIVVPSLFSQGAGPLPEKSYPYCGKKKMTQYEYMLANEEAWKQQGGDEIADVPAKDLEDFYQVALADYKNTDYYSRHDDWSLAEKHRNKNMGYVLKDGNLLPDFSVRDKEGRWKAYNKAGWKAVKSEINKGRGVACTYQEDIWAYIYTNDNNEWNEGEEWKEEYENQEKPYGEYLNTDTWAHYVPSSNVATHEVCIVGYDDNYPRENFLKGRDYSGKSKTPPANGAWIVKNSYGSETEDTVNAKGRPIGKGQIGVKNKAGKHTGYIYISYYDRTLTEPQTFVFGKDLKGRKFKVYQHDYMAGINGYYQEASGKGLKSANVFKMTKKAKLRSVGYRTQKAGSVTGVKIYRLGKKTNNPEKGKLIKKFTVKDKYAGFHRHNLKKAVRVRKGHRIAVVCTTYVKSKKKKTYSISAAAAEGKHKNYVPGRSAITMYGKAVVGKGQSYLYKKGKWSDWKKYKKSKTAKKIMAKIKGDNIQVDNFPIKLYVTAK